MSTSTLKLYLNWLKLRPDLSNNFIYNLLEKKTQPLNIILFVYNYLGNEIHTIPRGKNRTDGNMCWIETKYAHYIFSTWIRTRTLSFILFGGCAPSLCGGEGATRVVQRRDAPLAILSYPRAVFASRRPRRATPNDVRRHRRGFKIFPNFPRLVEVKNSKKIRVSRDGSDTTWLIM